VGFFDKMKGMVQAVTGGAARVTIECDDVAIVGQDLRVRITTTSAGGEVKSQGAFVDLLATERISIPAAALPQSGQMGGTQATGQPPSGPGAWQQPQAEVTAPTFPSGGNFGPPQQSAAGQPEQPRDLNLSHVTFSQAFQIAPALVLAPGETRVFEGMVRIPTGLQPTYSGKHASHEWHIRGRLEAWGNDPDSGYQPLRVRLS
jgi:hypothetical protein